MYDKQYRIENIQELTRHNYLHKEVMNRICYPAYLKVGERGWLLWEDEFHMQKLHTSIIEDLKYEDDRIVITTRNSVYILRVI